MFPDALVALLLEKVDSLPAAHAALAMGHDLARRIEFREPLL